MRVVVVVFAALLTVALAAFGVVAAHKTPASLIAFAQHFMSPAQATTRAGSSTSVAAQPAAVTVPVIKVSQTSAASEPAAPAAAPAPLVVAQSSAAAAETPRPPPAPAPSPAPAGRQRRKLAVADHPSGVPQSRRAWHVAHRPDRYDRRAGLRHRAFQAIRLPAREGSRADLRRRPVAGKHSDGAQGAAGQLRAAPPSSRSANTPPGIRSSPSNWLTPE